MPRVYLGLGSNISAEENFRLAIRELRWRYRPLDLSAVYANSPVGFDGDEFLNMVVGFDTEDSAADIHTQIELIHGLAGRDRGAGRFVSRPLDVDLLLYGSEIIDDPHFHVPRGDVLQYDFVLQPLTELAPELVHPETGQTLKHHWSAFATERPPLKPVRIDLK